MRPRLNSPAVVPALAALAYLFLTISITYPVAFRLTTHIAGLPDNDSYEFVWSTWWFKHALIDLRQNPAHITALNYPQGLEFPLMPAMAQAFVLSLPLAGLASPVVAFNVTYLLSFPLCGLAGYWLCAEASGSRRAGFVGGLIWAFFPNKSGHALAGHLFQMAVFSLPVAALFLTRLLQQPSARNALWAGLATAVAATIHPVNMAYCLLPVALVLVGVELWTGWRRRASSRNTMFKLALAAGIALVLAGPLYLPALAAAGRGGLDFLATGGTVGFSTDLLAFFLPAPGNPLIARTPLAALSRKVVLSDFENIAYLGWAPLALAAFGTRRRWAAGRAWLILGGIAAVLSLGPLLQFGGGLVRVPVESESYPVLMPYALVAQLPPFGWSRTPGRLNETAMLAVAVLASLGMAEWLALLKGRRAGWVVWGVACALIPAEYLVRWPMPTALLDVPPAIRAMAGDNSFEAVLNFPVPDNDVNLLALLQQTVHQHPLIGGRVYRDMPGTLATHDFLSRLILAPAGADIGSTPSEAQRLAALSSFGAGRVVYQPEGDPDRTARPALDELLGPALADEGSLAVYAVPSAPVRPTDQFYVFGENWGPVEDWGGPLGRWFHGLGTFYLFSGERQTGSLAFTAVPGQHFRRLIVKVNGQEMGAFGVGDWAHFQTAEFELAQGLNRIEFVDPDGAWTYVGDPRCQGGSAVAGPFPLALPCEAGRQQAGEYSLAIQALTFARHPVRESPGVFGGTFELQDAFVPAQVRGGETLTLHLTWRAARPPDRDLTVFAHLLDAEGNFVAGYDSYPARGEYPTTRWPAGETVAHSVPLAVPAGAAPGDYTVEVGWYDLGTQERLALENGETSLDVGEVQVER